MLALALLVPAPAAAGKRMEMALADDPVFLDQAYYQRDRAFEQARTLGVTRMRAVVTWASVLGPQAKLETPPERPEYYLKRHDQMVDAAAANGIRVQLILTGPAPAFAAADRRIGPNRPDARMFGDFARAVAEHFEGRVDRYSLWNEPNYVSWLSPLAESPAIYRSLYLAGYAGIKSADPKATVLMGETAPFGVRGKSVAPLEFLRRAACVTKRYKPDKTCAAAIPAPGGALRADAYAHHPYDFMHPPNYRYKGSDNVTIGTLPRLTSALDRLSRVRALVGSRRRPLQLNLTEFGYFQAGSRRISEARQSKYLPRAFAIAQRNARVREMLQYGLVVPPPNHAGAYFQLGIVGLDGQPRPPFDALAAWVRSALKRRSIAKPRSRIVLPAAKPSPEPPPPPPPPSSEPAPLLPPLPPLP
ncbi:MAG TPA: cellulase family glycosylhydrolase [Thermoleophilaceae bacterium]